MDIRHKWDLGNGFSSVEKNKDEKKQSHAIHLLLNAQNVKQFYQFHQHEKTYTNGQLHRNEIKKLIHLTLNQDKYGLNQIHVESFDRLHLNQNLALSEKEFLDQVASILHDVKLEVNTYGNDFKIKNLNEIESQSQRVIEKLQKNYAGENAERHFRFLKTFYAQPKSISKNLFNYKLYGLLLPKFYAYYDVGQLRQHTVRYTTLMENKVISILEKAEIVWVNEEKNTVQMYVSGKLAENINQEACRFILSNRAIKFSENDQAILDNYEGNFEFNKKTGVIINSELNIGFSFGENYRKNITYSLKSISYEEA